MRNVFRLGIAGAIALAIVLIGTAPAMAGNFEWVGTTGSYDVTDNWNEVIDEVFYPTDVIPGPDDYAYIDNGGTMQLGSGTFTPDFFYCGQYPETTAGTADIFGTGVLDTNRVYIGQSGTGTLNLSDSAEVYSGTGNFQLGQGSGSMGTINVSDSAVLNIERHAAKVGDRGAGIINQNGGTVHLGTRVDFGGAANGDPTIAGHAIYNLSGGSCDGTEINVGYRGKAEFNISGGSLSLTEELWMGSSALDPWVNTDGTLRISGQWNPGTNDIVCDKLRTQGGKATLAFEIDDTGIEPVGVTTWAYFKENTFADISFAPGVPFTTGQSFTLVDTPQTYNFNLIQLVETSSDWELAQDGADIVVNILNDFTLPLLGDFDGNGAVNGLDIPGFKDALADPDAWAAANPGMPHPDELGDFDNNGAFNGLDIPGFKDTLAGTSAVPEPATLMLVALGAGALLKRRRSA